MKAVSETEPQSTREVSMTTTPGSEAQESGYLGMTAAPEKEPQSTREVSMTGTPELEAQDTLA
jgi:hypothetical protein